MKRIALFGLPILAMFVVVGLGLLVFRGEAGGLRPRLAAAREAVADALDDIADDIEEAIE